MTSDRHPIAGLRRLLASRTALLRVLAVAGCAAPLGGCYTTQLAYTDDAGKSEIADDYRLRHPITVREGAHEVELFIASRRGGLNAAQRAQVLSFAHEWHREATGGVLVDVPTGTPNESAAASVMPEIRSLLVSAGVPAEAIATRAYHPENQSTLATIRIGYPAMQATAGPCGLWPHDLGPSFDRTYNENTDYWNLGCASQRNLAAMVEDPADLVQPRGETPAYEPRRSVVIDKYRQGLPTAATNPDANKGKISDVGQ
jgi:pilus assembly protein CpaD